VKNSLKRGNARKTKKKKTPALKDKSSSPIKPLKSGRKKDKWRIRRFCKKKRLKKIDSASRPLVLK